MTSPENNPADLNQQNKESMDDLKQQSETPTPRTDAADLDWISGGFGTSRPDQERAKALRDAANYIRQLERENADLRSQIRELTTGEVS